MKSVAARRGSANPPRGTIAGTLTRTLAQGSTTWVVPTGVYVATFEIAGNPGTATGVAGGNTVQITGSLAIAAAGILPGSSLHLIFEAGAAGGGTGAGLGPGGAGGHSASIRSAAAKANSLVMAAGGGGASGGNGGAASAAAPDTEGTSPSDATAGANGAFLQVGGGGGGAGWRGGTGGASNNGGSGGFSMAHSLYTSNVVVGGAFGCQIKIDWMGF